MDCGAGEGGYFISILLGDVLYMGEFCPLKPTEIGIAVAKVRLVFAKKQKTVEQYQSIAKVGYLYYSNPSDLYNSGG